MIEGIPALGSYIFYFSTKTRKGFYQYITKEITSIIDKGRILDIGTGSGNLPLQIAKKTSNLEIIGIDISRVLIKIARKTAEKENLKDIVKFKVGNAYELKFENSFFDMVVSSGVIHHLKYPLKAFNEIYRVLKPKREAWVYDLVRDASIKETNQGLKEMHIPIFPSLLFFRLHGLKNEQYFGKIKQFLKKSSFKKYKFEKKNCLMKIVLNKI